MNFGLLQRCSKTAYPGKQAAVFYLHGCNLKCPYCYVSHLLRKEEIQDSDGERMIKFLKARLNRLDAVVLTGGEPLVHDSLPGWIARIKDLGLAVRLETNGTFPEKIRHLLNEGLLDSIAMDVKAPSDNYANVCGRQLNTDIIKNSIWIIKQSGIDHEFRTTVVPGYHTMRELKKIAEMINGAQRMVVQDFVSSNPLRRDLTGRPSFPHKSLKDIRKFCEKRVGEFEIRGHTQAIPMPALRRRRRKTFMVEPDTVDEFVPFTN